MRYYGKMDQISICSRRSSLGRTARINIIPMKTTAERKDQPCWLVSLCYYNMAIRSPYCKGKTLLNIGLYRYHA